MTLSPSHHHQCPDWPLATRPGFLIRRLHQIHVALFAEACRDFDVTTVQYSLLSALTRRDQADQTTLAGDVMLDRTTATGALKRLQARGVIARVRSPEDRRARVWRLTDAGVSLLKCAEAAARQAHVETVADLSATEQATFLALLGRLVASHEGRADEDAAPP